MSKADKICTMKEVLYEVRCLKSTEDMILALAGQFKQLSHEPETFGCLNGIRTHDLCDALSLIHISEPTRRVVISYAVFCLKKKNKKKQKQNKTKIANGIIANN